MHINFLGFSLSLKSTKISLKSYFDYLNTLQDQQFNFGSHPRLIYINPNYDNDYYTGLLVTIKDQKRFCRLQSQNGKHFLKIGEIENGEQLMDFNFFVVNKHSGQGIYQYYHHSCALNAFGVFLARRFTDMQDTERFSFFNKSKGRLNFEILVRHEKLEELINELAEVKSFEYHISTPTILEPQFAPVKGNISRKKTKLSFKKISSVSDIARCIFEFVTQTTTKRGRVHGIDTFGDEKIIQILNTPDNFGEYDYDEIISQLDSLNISEFHNSWLTSELLKKCRGHKQIFEAQHENY